MALLSGAALAEDADRFRPYLRFHSGDIEPAWGVDDHWSFGLGADFDKYLGAELALDFFERDYDVSNIGTLGEVSAWNLVPEVRLRRAFLNERLVPYAIAGIGPSFLQFNDAKFAGYGRQIDIEGVTFAVAAGAGLEYFFADNFTFGIESRYMFINPIDGTVDGDPVRVDLSSPLFTFGLRAYFSQNEPTPLVTGSDPRRRLYFGVRVGGSVLTDGRWTSDISLDPEVSAVGGTVNETGGLVLGVDFRAPWGIELAVDSLEQGIDMDGVGLLGEYGMGIVIPQLRLRHPLGPGRWVPYFTGGVGIGYGEVNDRTEAGTRLGADAKGIHPALGVGGGLEYFVISNLSLSADFRWVYTWGHEIQVGNGPIGSGDISALLLTVGFRAYLFDL